MAKHWLLQNKTNRRLSEKLVVHFVNQMRQGNWELTGDSIKFAIDGTLLDGQHRLNAIVKYDKPVESIIVEGLKKEVFSVLDTGKVRSAADIISASGYRNSTNLAAISRAILLYKAGRYSQTAGDKHFKVTNKMCLEFVEKTKELEEIASYCQNHIYQNFRFAPLSIIGMLYFIFSRKNQTKCDDFFAKYSNGIDLGETNPIRHLREKLMKDSVNKSRLNATDKAALIVYTWNNFMQNKKVTQLLLPKNYTFPKPI